METKKTIAILGLTIGRDNPLLSKLASNNRLLIVSTHADDFNELSNYIQGNKGELAIELIDCAKDGCWEADIIILWNGFQQDPEEIKKLQTVATQKIVTFFTEQERDHSNHLTFPHSKMVTVYIQPDIREVTITGDDSDAVQRIIELINDTDYYHAVNSPLTHDTKTK